jgi:hypothetical protein
MRLVLAFALACVLASTLRAQPAELSSAAAARLAVRLANAECEHHFGRSPFAASSGKLRVVGGHWQWEATTGHGYGDLRAVVSFASSGADRSVQVSLLDTRADF